MSALLDLSTPTNTEPSADAHLYPTTLVVQPANDLIGAATQTLQQALTTALDQVTTQVIVDLLWVSQSDRAGIQVLITAMQQAKAVGKSLIFQAMKGNIKKAIEQEIASQQEQAFGSRQDWFNADMGTYCDRR